MSLSYAEVRAACRARLLTLTAASTGSTSLSASSAGYARASGSFLADGFRPGMEVTASGFGTAANNGTGIVTYVSATELRVSGYTLAASDGAWTRTARTLAAEAAGAGRTVLAGLPTVRAWEGVRHEILDGVPWIEESLIGGPTARPFFPDGSDVVAEPQYQTVWHLPSDVGTGAQDSYVDGLFALFAPGTAMALPSGRNLRVRQSTGPFMAALGRLRPGFLTTSITFPLQLYTPVTTS